MKRIVSCLMTVFFLSLVSAALSESKTWNVDLQTGMPAKYYATPSLEQAIDGIKKRTEGAVNIRLFSDLGLGIKGPDMLRAVGEGSLGMAYIVTPYISGEFPLAGLVDLPLLVQSPSEVLGAYSVIWEDLDKELSKRGVKGLTYYSFAKQVMASKKPVTTVADWKGLKVRGPGGEAQKLVEALGATPATIAAPEMYLALQRGTVLAAITAASSHLQYGNYEVTKYVSDFGWYITNLVVINKKLWEEWPDNIKYIVLDELLKDQRRSTVNATLLGGPHILIEKGMTLTHAKPEMVEKAYQIAPDIWEKWAARYSPLEQDLLSKVRKFLGR
jgi:TRAP-type C4-dicarboxylate transport system substrate-binding protein